MPRKTDRPPEPEAIDSTPTPIINLGYSEIMPLLEAMSKELRDREQVVSAQASRLSQEAHLLGKNPLALKRASQLRSKAAKLAECACECGELAFDALRVKLRVSRWPELKARELVVEKSDVCERYLLMRRRANVLTGKVKPS